MDRKVPIKQKSWIYRYPRTFVSLSTAAALLVLFSKPIYDIFISTEPLPDLNELLKERELERQKKLRRN